MPLHPAPAGYPIKLVRDLTPEILNSTGDPGDLWYGPIPEGTEPKRWLKLKLVEEAGEYLEGLFADPVIAAYLRERRGLLCPSLWAVQEAEDADPAGTYLNDEGDALWDCLVGELQREGLCDRDLMSADANLVEVDSSS